MTETKPNQTTRQNLLTVGEEMGRLSAEQLRSIAALQQQMKSVGARIPLGQLLLDRKYVTPFQLKEMRQELLRRVTGTKVRITPQQTAKLAPPIMRFGNFDVLEMISEKPRSRVYKARDTKMNRIVALKLLPGEALTDKHWAERFQREIETAGKLVHPNIATAYGSGTVDGRPYLVMEFVDGMPLSEKLEREGNFPELTAWNIAREVTKALAFADSMGVLHRDVKPDNIILSTGGQVKVIDLGLSKLVSSTQALTMDGATVGTPFYISPEQARGNQDLDIRSDLYSLGCTVFQMLTGATPFYSENFIEVMRMQATAPRPDPRQVLPEISHRSARLVMRMMELERERRLFPTALLAEMDEVIAECPQPVESVRPVVELNLSPEAAEPAAIIDLAPPRPQPRNEQNPPPANLIEAARELGLINEERARSIRELKDRLEAMSIELPLAGALVGRGYLTPTQVDRVCGLLRSRGYSRRPVAVPLPPEMRKIGEFELIQQLSAKTNSRIFHARDRAMKREVALRVVPATSGRSRLERFNREVQLLARLTHPNIATAYGAGEHNGSPYMATEYIDGISLAERLELQGRLPERTSWRIAREIASGLAYAADGGVLHRDIKPGNILCGYDGRIKIIDFGLSKSRDDRESLTMEGTTVGTPYYIAPEQAIGTNTVDGRSDIYSMGCTVYQMLTGSPPFYRDEFYEVMECHANAARPDVRKLRPELTPDSARLIQRMMAINVDARPDSAKALVEEIDALLAILPEDASTRQRITAVVVPEPRRYKASTSTMIPAVKEKPIPEAALVDVPPPPPAPVVEAPKKQIPVRARPKNSAFQAEQAKRKSGLLGWIKSWFS